MSLVSVDDLKALVTTPLTNAQLQVIIDRVEADVTDKIGAPYADALELVEVATPAGSRLNVYTRRPIEAISSITEKRSMTADTETVVTTAYYTWADQGRIERIDGLEWGPLVTITYRPTDQREKRRAAIIDLVRLHLQRTAMMSEDVAREYSYEAPDNWEAELRKVVRRLAFRPV